MEVSALAKSELIAVRTLIEFLPLKPINRVKDVDSDTFFGLFISPIHSLDHHLHLNMTLLCIALIGLCPRVITLSCDEVLDYVVLPYFCCDMTMNDISFGFLLMQKQQFQLSTFKQCKGKSVVMRNRETWVYRKLLIHRHSKDH